MITEDRGIENAPIALEDFMWSTLEIGKHAGRSLPQILFSDPDYFFWAVEKKILQGRLATEAAELAWKARHIKIPKPDPENWCVEYFRVSSSALYRTPNGQELTLVSALLQKEFRA